MQKNNVYHLENIQPSIKKCYFCHGIAKYFLAYFCGRLFEFEPTTSRFEKGTISLCCVYFSYSYLLVQNPLPEPCEGGGVLQLHRLLRLLLLAVNN